MSRMLTLLLSATGLALAGCVQWASVMKVDLSHMTPELRDRVSKYSETELAVLKRYYFGSGEFPEHRVNPPPKGSRTVFSLEFSPSVVSQSIVEAANEASGCSAQSCPIVRLVAINLEHRDLTDVGRMSAWVKAAATVELLMPGDVVGRRLTGPVSEVFGASCPARVLEVGDHSNECFRRSFGVVIADATLKSMLATLAHEEHRSGSH